MSNGSSNEPIFVPPPKSGDGSNASGGNFLTANTTNHRRLLMAVGTLLLTVLTSLFVYKYPLTFRDFIIPPIVGLAIFELMFRTRERLKLVTLPLYVLGVLIVSQILYWILYSASYLTLWSPVPAFQDLISNFPYNLYVLIESSILTGLAYYLIKIYRHESWVISEKIPVSESSNEAVGPLEPVTNFGSFTRRYRKQILGFFGWFAIASALAPGSFGLITTPATIIFLIAYGVSKNQKGVAGGILIAVALNFAVSLVRELQLNAMCFVPFYIDTGF